MASNLKLVLSLLHLLLLLLDFLFKYIHVAWHVKVVVVFFNLKKLSAEAYVVLVELIVFNNLCKNMIKEVNTACYLEIFLYFFKLIFVHCFMQSFKQGAQYLDECLED